jgi:hypothetical protein
MLKIIPWSGPHCLQERVFSENRSYVRRTCVLLTERTRVRSRFHVSLLVLGGGSLLLLVGLLIRVSSPPLSD